VPHYSAIGETSMPLTEPDLQISHIRLFSYPHFTGDKVDCAPLTGEKI